MNEPARQIRIAILAFPDATVSTIYGMYDLFMSVGRDWGFLTSGAPGQSLIQPAIVGARDGSFITANGIALARHDQTLLLPGRHQRTLRV